MGLFSSSTTSLSKHNRKWWLVSRAEATFWAVSPSIHPLERTSGTLLPTLLWFLAHEEWKQDVLCESILTPVGLTKQNPSFLTFLASLFCLFMNFTVVRTWERFWLYVFALENASPFVHWNGEKAFVLLLVLQVWEETACIATAVSTLPWEQIWSAASIKSLNWKVAQSMAQFTRSNCTFATALCMSAWCNMACAPSWSQKKCCCFGGSWVPWFGVG